MRFYGEVGYGTSVEDPPDSGVWKDTITEHSYYGEVINNARQLVPRSSTDGMSVNDNITINNQISVVADQYLVDNFMDIKYVKWAGKRWIVTNVDVDRPRLIMTLGGVYNGPTP